MGIILEKVQKWLTDKLLTICPEILLPIEVEDIGANWKFCRILIYAQTQLPNLKEHP